MTSRIYHEEQGRRFYLVKVGEPFTPKVSEAAQIPDDKLEETWREINAYLMRIRRQSLVFTEEKISPE